MIKYKVEDIQNVLNLLNEIPVTGLQAMNRMVAAATILERGTMTKEDQEEPNKPEKVKVVKRVKTHRRRK